MFEYDLQKLTTPLEELYPRVESIDFCAQINIASGFHVLVDAMMSSETFKDLCLTLRFQDGAIEETLDHMDTLASVPFDHQYAHPHDSALTAYGFAIGVLAAEYISRIQRCLRSVPNGCWVYSVANSLR